MKPDLTRHAGRAVLLFLIPLVLVLFSIAALAQPLMVIDGSELTPTDYIPPFMEERGVVRLATLQLPLDIFVQPQDPGVSEPIVIPIEEDRAVALVEKERSEVGNRVYVTGEVADVPYSRFFMVLEDGQTKRGEIRLHNEAIDLSLLETTPTHIRMRMITVDPSLLPEGGEPVERPLPDTVEGVPPPPPPPPPSEDETDTVVKVLVVYTEAAKDAVAAYYLGTKTIEELIDDAVFRSNFAFKLHGELELELVPKEEVNFVETGDMLGDLDRLTCPCDHQLKGIGDNHLNEVFELWKTHEADVVSLWMNYPGESGWANIMNSVSTNFAPFATSVVDWGAAFYGYSFEHEIGHNFGARHHRNHDPTDGLPYMFNHGGWNEPDQRVTLMTYRSVCPDGVICDRVTVWSNPDYPPLGAWGVATGALAADNARTLRDSKATISQLFEQGEGWIGCCIKSGNLFHTKYQPGYCP